jgi:hypothetical protein
VRGENVVDVNYNQQEIISALNKILNAERPQSSAIYGGGEAGRKIAEIIADLPLVYHKTIAY